MILWIELVLNYLPVMYMCAFECLSSNVHAVLLAGHSASLCDFLRDIWTVLSPNIHRVSSLSHSGYSVHVWVKPHLDLILFSSFLFLTSFRCLSMAESSVSSRDQWLCRANFLQGEYLCSQINLA